MGLHRAGIAPVAVCTTPRLTLSECLLRRPHPESLGWGFNRLIRKRPAPRPEQSWPLSNILVTSPAKAALSNRARVPATAAVEIVAGKGKRTHAFPAATRVSACAVARPTHAGLRPNATAVATTAAVVVVAHELRSIHTAAPAPLLQWRATSRTAHLRAARIWWGGRSLHNVLAGTSGREK